MADTAAKTGAAEAFYTTARSLGTGTTSTVTMQVWRLLSDHLENAQAPMSGSELSQATGLTIEQIDHMFSQTYYQKHYGFRRFDSLEAWQQWAMAEGVLFNPELHAVEPKEDEVLEDEDEAVDAEAEDEE